MQIIQLYVGSDHDGHTLWRDTVWPSLAEAQEHYPEEIYREITTEYIGVPIERDFNATEESCELESFFEDEATEALS